MNGRFRVSAALQEEEPDVARYPVSLFLMLSQLRFPFVRLNHGKLQALSVEEWQQVDSHPCIPSSIDVQFHIRWIKINDFTVYIIQLPVAFWYGM